ncbi:DUF4224 domain-containing protein [Cupriavidus necator]
MTEEAQRIIEITRQHWEQQVDNRLMSEQDICDVTGLKRRSLQAKWFERHFGITPVQRADGRIIMTWAALEGLQAKRAGVLPGAGVPARTPLIPIRKAA